MLLFSATLARRFLRHRCTKLRDFGTTEAKDIERGQSGCEVGTNKGYFSDASLFLCENPRKNGTTMRMQNQGVCAVRLKELCAKPNPKRGVKAVILANFADIEQARACMWGWDDIGESLGYDGRTLSRAYYRVRDRMANGKVRLPRAAEAAAPQAANASSVRKASPVQAASPDRSEVSAPVTEAVSLPVMREAGKEKAPDKITVASKSLKNSSNPEVRAALAYFDIND